MIHQRRHDKAYLTKTLFHSCLQKNGDIYIQQIYSSDNPIDLFTMALSTSIFDWINLEISNNIFNRMS